jgi:GT2 family glycosyltransferase
VLKNDYENYQIIVVDNDSPNNSMEYIINWAEGKQEVVYDENSKLKHLSQPFEVKPLEYVYYTKEEALKGGNKEKELKLYNPLIFIQAGENRGFAAGNNIGIKYALSKNDFEYICLLNNDTVVERTFLLYVIKKMKNNEKIGICASKINYYSNPKIVWSNGGIFNHLTSQTRHIDYQQADNDQTPSDKITFLTGCMWTIRKEIITKVGLLNEDYFMYVEDLEYSYKVLKKGYSLEVEAKSKIYHKVGASSNGEVSEFSSYYMMKNKLKFIRENLQFYNKFFSYSFIFITRLIRFPQWLINGYSKLITSQVKAVYDELFKTK